MAKKSTPETPKAEAPEATPSNQLHGVELSSGDLKSGGTSKKPLLAVLPIGNIAVQKGFNSRTNIPTGEVEQLANNIKSVGLLQPLVVRPDKDKDGSFLVVNGHKRLAALKINGIEYVPVSIRSDLSDDDALAKAINGAENSDDLRSALNPIEVGRMCRDLATIHSWTPASIASKTGLHPQRVRRCLTLLEAPDDVQKKVVDNKLSLIAGLELAKLDDATRKAISAELNAKFEAAEKSGEKVDLSAQGVKAMAKAAAKAGGTVATDGKNAKNKVGKSRDAALTAWKGSRVKQQEIVKLAAIVNAADEEAKQTAEYFETRGTLIGLLWDRGDLDSYTLPSTTTEDPKELKVLKVFAALVASEAANAKTEPAEESAEEPAEDGEAAEEPAPKAAKKGKAK